MKNTTTPSSSPAAFRAFIYRLLDRTFFWSEKEQGADAKTKAEWARLRENSFLSIAAMVAFMPTLGVTWLIIQFVLDSGQQYVGFTTVVMFLVLAGYGIMLWNTVSLARCVLLLLRRATAR
jgi:hypothetical protein